MFPWVVMVSHPLTDGWAPERVLRHAHRLPELLNVLCDRTGLAGRSRPHSSVRPLQDHVVRE